ncbi:hypothetical protein OMEGA_136 [Klebsiella phage vB_KaeM_KaOmega]|nr:hypothetical protein OMEGA_136 [Klebsiella phage vB_KaeM_KaOmega]
MNKVRCTYVEEDMECHFTVGKEYTCKVDESAADPDSMIVIGEDKETWYAERLDDNNVSLLGIFVKFEFI